MIITVDATEFMARVVIDDAVSVGVIYSPGNSTQNTSLPIGQALIVPEGTIQTLYVFNGGTGGQATFTVAYRSAVRLLSAALAVGLSSLAVLL